MKVSYNWLSELMDLKGISHEELFKKISLHIIEIESYNKLVNSNNLVIGQVISCVKHPNSDHLHVCEVDVKDEVLQIVCGAPNCRNNIKVIVAKVGCRLPIGLEIKSSKVRDVMSNGMLCSLDELGIEEKYIEKEYKDKIFVFDDDAEVGSSALDYLNFNDYVIDLSLTPNRSDLLSMLGVAYDVSAILDKKVNFTMPNIEELITLNKEVVVKNQSSNCDKYLCRIVENVKIASSPWWLKSRLICAGIRPINNIVDITNYVLLLFGQPLHAFDLDKLGNEIIVRDSKKDETITTLDNVSRKLVDGDILICDKNSTPVCLGGVMGGLSTEVENNTTSILLEAAVFNKKAVRQTSQRLDLKSESSQRFEKGINKENTKKALDYASYLISLLCKDVKLSNVYCDNDNIDKERVVDISTCKINSVLGTNLTTDEVKNIFRRLDFKYALMNDDFKVVIPNRRCDLEESYQDIIEEVIRIYGYDNLPTTISKTTSIGRLTTKQKVIRIIRETLSSLGLNETVTYSLVSKDVLKAFTIYDEEEIELMMPLSSDKEVMRQSLISGLIDVIKYNNNRKEKDISIFEIGKKYTKEKETELLAIGISNIFDKSLWQNDVKKVDFYTLKGIVDNLFTKLGITLHYKKDENLNKNFHPKQTASIYIKDQMIGYIAKLHPSYLVKNDLDDIFIFEVDLDKVVENYNPSIVYSPISKYPSITRDLSLVVDKNISYQSIIDVIKKYAKKYLVSVNVFDIYKPENQDTMFVGVKLVFIDVEKTLESIEVDKIINSILNRLDYHLDIKLR